MFHQICSAEGKKAKVKSFSCIGKNDDEFQILWENLPSILISETTASNLALIIDYAYDQIRRGENKNN